MQMRLVSASWLAVVVVSAGLTGSAFGQATSAEKAGAATDELLGFSRYLPPDTRGYVSALRLGKLRSELAESNAWGRIADQPEVAAALAEIQKNLESEELPPPARTAIELLKSAGESEVSLAVSAEASQDLLNIARLMLTSVVVMAPSPLDPDSQDGRRLELKRAPLRVEWTKAALKTRLPSLVVAARVKDHKKYRAFVEAMLDLGWQAGLQEMSKNAPPPVKTALREAYSHVEFGDLTLIRFHLRLGDLIPPGGLEQGIDRLPLEDGEKQAIALAISDLTVDAHLGFIGEYLKECQESEGAEPRI